MSSRHFSLALLLSSLPLAGCGTVANLARSPDEDGKIPFGGVKQDLTCIKKSANGESGTHAGEYPQVALMLLCVADLPFSLVGDVVMWPYTVAFTRINEPVPTPTLTIASPPVTPGQSPIMLPDPTKIP
jgi:uncharacterized protein YceK